MTILIDRCSIIIQHVEVYPDMNAKIIIPGAEVVGIKATGMNTKIYLDQKTE